MSVARLALVMVVALAACRRETTQVHLSLPASFGGASRLRWSPRDAVIRAVDTANGVELDVTAGAKTIRFEHPEACPLDVTLPAAAEAKMVAWVGAPDEVPQAGFGQTVTLVVTPGCPEARKGTITWVEREGTLAALDPQPGGFVVRATLKSLAHTRTSASSHGTVIPISYGQRGHHELVGTWSGPDHANLEVRSALNASTRVTGLPNLSVGQLAYLEGTDWAVVERPAGAAERLELSDSASTLFQADRAGRWVLQNGKAAPFSLQVGTFASTPLDCGRSGCHAPAAEAAKDSPMTHAFEHRLAQAPATIACWLGCHVVGEKGLHDEGFFDVARSFPRAAPTALPLALVRETGVQCLNCHGSGRIPEPSARWTVLQTGVCATCHDAPPRYGHVQAWRGSAMARADATRAEREAPCSTCHTTAGFLGRPSPSPDDAAPLGITCAACHAPHAAHGARLLRALPEVLPVKTDPTTALCAQCHAPKGTKNLPESTAASLIVGRGAVRLDDGSPLDAESVGHSALPGGCMACHSHSDEKVERGQSHGFVARAADCTSCHAERNAPYAKAWAERVGALMAPPAHDHGSPPVDLSTRAGRIQWNSALLLRDRAAWAHNPSYASMIARELERARPLRITGQPTAVPER